MNFPIRSIPLFILLFLFVTSCKKDEKTYSDTPVITFVSASATSVKEYSEPVTLIIEYLDGNGDLGENNPDKHNLFVVDNRINVTYKYRIPQLSPTGNDIAIRGKLNVKLNNLAITDNSMQQSVVFSIYVMDRSGNISNTVMSTPVVVTKN